MKRLTNGIGMAQTYPWKTNALDASALNWHYREPTAFCEATKI